MINDLSAACYVVFLVLALLSPVLPLFLVWRSASLSVVACAGGALLSGPVRGADKDFGYAMAMALLSFFVVAVVAALIVRVGIAAARKRLTCQSLAGPQTEWRRWIDRVALAATGCVAGLALAIFLAHLLGGSAGGPALDFGIATAAFVVAVGLASRRRGAWGIPVIATCASLAVIALVGSGQPSRILDGAEVFADGRPWCLATPQSTAPISSPAQLGFFSLQKGTDFDPHLGLLVRDGDGFATAHWSIRQQRFVAGLNGSVRSCHPRTDFADAVATGKIDHRIFAVGQHLYAVPPELSFNATPDRLYVNSDIVSGPEDNQPRRADRIEINYDPGGFRVPQDARPLGELSAPENIALGAVLSGQHSVVAGTDPVSRRRVVISCRSNAWEGPYCGVRVADADVTYSFHLPLADLALWSDATDRVAALFESLRLPD